jgi:DUF4097 and DUF4098 domain-containing protein YvlB
MMHLILLVAGALTQNVATDTSVRVRPGMRLNVDAQAGSVVVRGDDRYDVRIRSLPSSDVRLVVDTAPGVLNVTARRVRGVLGVAEIVITIPRSMSVTIGRGDVDVDVAEVEGEIVATVRDGTLKIDGGRGVVMLRTSHGPISVVNARGHITARTLNSDIHVADAAGDIEVEGSDGDVLLERIDADRVDVSTVDGKITYDGRLKPNGHYSFATHDQGVRLTIPANSGATITMATVTGSSASDFPLTLRKDLGRGRFSFVIGDGSAQVSVSSFEGLMEIRRSR